MIYAEIGDFMAAARAKKRMERARPDFPYYYVLAKRAEWSGVDPNLKLKRCLGLGLPYLGERI